MEGNSATDEQSRTINSDGYPTSKTTSPDIEDINRDNNLNETESYYQYRINLKPGMGIGDNFIYVYEGAEDEKEEKARYQEVYDAGFNTASIILKYLENSSKMFSEHDELLNKDESNTHELKSTLRINT